MCEILIHDNSFESAIFHVHALYRIFFLLFCMLKHQGMCQKQDEGVGNMNAYITSNSLVLDVWLCVFRCKCMHVCITFGLKGSHL